MRFLGWVLVKNGILGRWSEDINMHRRENMQRHPKKALEKKFYQHLDVTFLASLAMRKLIGVKINWYFYVLVALEIGCVLLGTWVAYPHDWAKNFSLALPQAFRQLYKFHRTPWGPMCVCEYMLRESQVTLLTLFTPLKQLSLSATHPPFHTWFFL